MQGLCIAIETAGQTQEGICSFDWYCMTLSLISGGGLKKLFEVSKSAGRHRVADNNVEGEKDE